MARTLTYTLPALLTLLVAGCVVGEAGAEAPPPPPAVDVAEVLVEPATLWGDVTGRVAAPETVEIRPRVSGYIDRVSFTEGELVEQGAVLFTVDPRPYQARVRAAQAELARARSQLTLSEREAERSRSLLENRAGSREEYEQRIAARDTALAVVSAAEAALEMALLDLQYTEIKAPIRGRVGRALVTRGNLAGADETLLTTVVSVDPMHVYFESDQRTFAASRGLLAAGDRPQVRIGLPGEEGYPHLGELDFVDNRLNGRTGTIQFRAVIPNPDDAFKAGQFARVEMPVEHVDQAVLVSGRAVLTDQDRRYVYVVTEGDVVERRDVEPGPSLDELVLIRSGLRSGERVVVNGLQKIFASGTPVQPELVAMRAAERATPQLAAR